MSDNLIEDLVEVNIEDNKFLTIKETLTRIGIANSKEKNLYQSCHILHKKGKYYIVHFKELFMLDGKNSSIDEEDLRRRNTIAKLLEEWSLCEINKNSLGKVENVTDMSKIKVIKYEEKDEWNLIPKYSIGERNFNRHEEE